jgi:hypothetical protein
LTSVECLLFSLTLQEVYRHQGLDLSLQHTSPRLLLARSSPQSRKSASKWTPLSCCRCNGAGAGFQLYSLINDVGWDLRAFVGYAPVLGAKVVAFRGTDSHSW